MRDVQVMCLDKQTLAELHRVRGVVLPKLDLASVTPCMAVVQSLDGYQIITCVMLLVCVSDQLSTGRST